MSDEEEYDIPAFMRRKNKWFSKDQSRIK
jgi:hypothetical protein